MTSTSIKYFQLPLFLVSLLIFLILYPDLHQRFPDYIAIVELLFALLMISGVCLLSVSRLLLLLISVLAFTIMMGVVVVDYTQSHILLGFVLGLELVFFSIIFLSLINYIYAQKRVTINKLFAAVTCYLVLGILFALIYAFVAVISPNAFKYTVSISTSTKPLNPFPHPEFFSEALYFSFVTLATLGYGDWVPTLGPIKMVASLEAIAGQLFLAILIARLVGLEIAQSIKEK